MKTLVVYGLISLSASIVASAQDCTQLARLLEAGEIKAAEELLPSLEGQNSAECLNLKGSYYLRKGRNDLAEMYFAQVVKLATDTPLKASGLNNLGLVYWNTGNTQKAIDYIHEALSLRQQANATPPVDLAASFNDLGLVYSREFPERALDYYEQAAKIYKETYGDNHAKTAQAMTNTGIAYQQLGLFGDAVINFEEALAIWRSIYAKGHPNEGFVYINLGRTSQLMNQPDDALTYYEKALSIYQEHYGQRHPEIASTLTLIGNIHNIKGDIERALQYYQKSLIANSTIFENESIESTPSIGEYFNANVLLNTLYYKSRALADLHFNKTLKFSDLKLSLEVLQTCDSLIDKVRQTITNESDKLMLGSIANQVYETGVELCKTMGDLVVKKDEYYALSFYFAEKSKSAVLLEAISDASAKNYAGIPSAELTKEQQLKSEIAYYEQLLAHNPQAAERSALFNLRSAYNNFINHLEQAYPSYFNLKYNTTIPTIEAIQQKMGEDELILSYFLTDVSKRIYIYEISKKRYRLHSQAQPEDFERYLKGLRNSLYFKVKPVYLLTAKTLGDALLPKRIDKNISKLIIIPTGALGTVPFETLLTEKHPNDEPYHSLSYLIKSYDISYEYATTLYFNDRQKTKPGERALLCAPVSFTSLPDLPATAEEVRSLQNIISKNHITPELLLGAEATENTLKSTDLSGYKMLHMATHGIVDQEHPELSRIYLADGDQEDGNLYSGEIYNLQLNAELVTLSACETGLGKVSKGEGIIGLSRALVYAGADNVIVSLWSVADTSTADLMVSFYSNMESHPQYGGPLRKAKLQMINTDYAAPYYWAPFILIGR